MIQAFMIFFFFLYIICETVKYNKLSAAKLSIKYAKDVRFYNKPICYIKLVFLVVSSILMFVNRISTGGALERTSIKSFIIMIVVYTLFIFVCIFDIYKIRTGYNEKMFDELNMTEEEREDYE